MKSRVVRLSDTEFIPQVYYILSGWCGVKGNRLYYTKEDTLANCVVRNELEANATIDFYKEYERRLELL